MTKNFFLEICVCNTEAARTAEAAGADRVELCEQLSIGGVTPSLELIEATVHAVAIPVHVLVRPRGGDFCYMASEFQQMQVEIEQSKKAGAAGVVVGVLLPTGQVDVDRSRELVELAAPMKVTFHRAFDETRDKEAALEEVIQTGAHCLLTSGGEVSALVGAERIARLRKQAGERIDIMPGAGLRLENIVEVKRQTGVRYLHGSFLRRSADGGLSQVLVEQDVREVVALLNRDSQV